MSQLRAVYTNGRVVTGLTHGDAFSKLSETEKCGNDFVIGRLNEATGQFEGDGQFFFAKKVLLLRHGEPAKSYDDEPDPSLSALGWQQIEKAFHSSRQKIPDLDNYTIYASPYRRTLEAATYFAEGINGSVQVREDLAEHQPSVYHLRNRWIAYPSYHFENHERYYDLMPETNDERKQRVLKVLASISSKSILISHCTFISDVIKLITNKCFRIEHGSVSIIDHNKVSFFNLPSNNESYQQILA